MFIEQNAALRDIGCQVAEFCMRHPLNMESQWDAYFISNLEYQVSDRALDKMKKGARVLWNRESGKRISTLIKDFSPTIAHIHNIYHHISWSILPILKRHRVPVLMTLHDLKLLCPAHSMYRSGAVCSKCASGAYLNAVRYGCVKRSRPGSLVAAMDNVLARTIGLVHRYVDIFIVPSRFYLQLFSDYGFEPHKLVYIPNFTTGVSNNSELTIGDRYLYFGRLGFEKGVQVLIKAASRAQAKLTIAGTGPSYDDLHSLAESLEVDCQFLGHLDQASLSREIQRCRAVIVPSISYENAPLTILEAMKNGKIVVGTRSGGITELIDEGVNGYLFDPHDEHGLYLHLVNLNTMRNHDLVLMGYAAIESVSRYSVDKYISSICNVYSAMVNNTAL